MSLPTWLRRARWAPLLTACACACTLASAAEPPAFVYGPYKDLALGMLPDGSLRGADGGDVVSSLKMPAGGPAPVLTWAFASGECGDEDWTGQGGQAVADANLAVLRRAGLAYIISTGGQAGVFTCASDAGMKRFIERYDTPLLTGLDFDIEGSQSAAAITALAQRLAVVQRTHPRLRLSVTLATLAASDGSKGSLNATGEQVLGALQAAGVQAYVVNLMVMDFGPATPANCVVRRGRCDMAASARQAVDNVSAKYGVPLSRIGLTAMIGMNDVVHNVFSLDDALRTARYVKQQRLAGLQYWSFDRDRACPPGTALTVASPTCHSLPGLAPLAYQRAFARGLR